jgi:hypothetical protein
MGFRFECASEGSDLEPHESPTGDRLLAAEIVPVADSNFDAICRERELAASSSAMAWIEEAWGKRGIVFMLQFWRICFCKNNGLLFAVLELERESKVAPMISR